MVPGSPEHDPEVEVIDDVIRRSVVGFIGGLACDYAASKAGLGDALSTAVGAFVAVALFEGIKIIRNWNDHNEPDNDDYPPNRHLDI